DTIEVFSEKIDCCDQCTKECVFELETKIETTLILEAKKNVKIFKQEISFTDEESGNITIFDTFFCDVAGKEKCKLPHVCIEKFTGEFTIDKMLAMNSGKMEFSLFSKRGKRLHFSMYHFKKN
ncbi:hypothetical protein MXB_2600, partial [Myxobolus squamalis]